MSRREFPVAVRKAAYVRSGGICEECHQPFQPDQRPEFDHIIEDALGGQPTIENVACICRACHKAKSIARAPFLAKAARLERKQRGITAPKRKLAGGRDSNWKIKVGGGAVRRDEE